MATRDGTGQAPMMGSIGPIPQMNGKGGLNENRFDQYVGNKNRRFPLPPMPEPPPAPIELDALNELVVSSPESAAWRLPEDRNPPKIIEERSRVGHDFSKGVRPAAVVVDPRVELMPNVQVLSPLRTKGGGANVNPLTVQWLQSIQRGKAGGAPDRREFSGQNLEEAGGLFQGSIEGEKFSNILTPNAELKDPFSQWTRDSLNENLEVDSFRYPTMVKDKETGKMRLGRGGYFDLNGKNVQDRKVQQKIAEQMIESRLEGFVDPHTQFLMVGSKGENLPAIKKALTEFRGGAHPGSKKVTLRSADRKDGLIYEALLRKVKGMDPTYADEVLGMVPKAKEAWLSTYAWRLKENTKWRQSAEFQKAMTGPMWARAAVNKNLKLAQKMEEAFARGDHVATELYSTAAYASLGWGDFSREGVAKGRQTFESFEDQADTWAAQKMGKPLPGREYGTRAGFLPFNPRVFENQEDRFGARREGGYLDVKQVLTSPARRAGGERMVLGEQGPLPKGWEVSSLPPGISGPPGMNVRTEPNVQTRFVKTTAQDERPGWVGEGIQYGKPQLAVEPMPAAEFIRAAGKAEAHPAYYALKPAADSIEQAAIWRGINTKTLGPKATVEALRGLGTQGQIAADVFEASSLLKEGVPLPLVVHDLLRSGVPTSVKSAEIIESLTSDFNYAPQKGQTVYDLEEQTYLSSEKAVESAEQSRKRAARIRFEEQDLEARIAKSDQDQRRRGEVPRSDLKDSGLKIKPSGPVGRAPVLGGGLPPEKAGFLSAKQLREQKRLESFLPDANKAFVPLEQVWSPDDKLSPAEKTLRTLERKLVKRERDLVQAGGLAFLEANEAAALAARETASLGRLPEHVVRGRRSQIASILGGKSLTKTLPPMQVPGKAPLVPHPFEGRTRTFPAVLRTLPKLGPLEGPGAKASTRIAAGLMKALRLL